ncbi:MAG: hypothetical protein AMXMBFR55_13300 [Gemmatimonadota bacterium]
MPPVGALAERLAPRATQTNSPLVTPAVRLLLVATIGAYLLQLSVPGLTEALVFAPRLVLLRPWTIVTYMFLHGGLGHLLFNMLALYFFGPRVEALLGTRSFVTLYFASGVTGALLSMFFSGTPILGASAAVFGVMLAFAWFWPDERIFIWGVLPVPARVLVIGTTVLALFGGFSGSRDGVAHFAHLGGYVGAFAYLKLRTRGQRRFRQVASAPTAARAPIGSTETRDVRTVPGLGSIDLSTVHPVNREAVTRLVDKVAAEGVAALTERERAFLGNFVSVGPSGANA